MVRLSSSAPLLGWLLLALAGTILPAYAMPENTAALCIDGVDNDGVGGMDCADANCTTAFCTDNDNDDFCLIGPASAPGSGVCTVADSDLTNADCDDSTDTRSPGNTEDDTTLCIDTIDNDCDLLTDLSDPDCEISDIDNDGDGVCESGRSDADNDRVCTGVVGPVDCDDNDDTRSPDLPENTNTLCLDTIDNDCDGLVDLVDLDTCSLTNLDNDGDGVCESGRSDGDGDGDCTGAVGTADCDDNDPTRSPDLPENTNTLCLDTIDNDCDGFVDLLDLDTCSLADLDNDGDGVCESGRSDGDGDGDCTGTVGTADCDDNDATRSPGLPENTNTLCLDAIDNDCDSLVDLLDLDTCSLANLDNDGDGICESGRSDDDSDGLCTGAIGLTDCDDDDPARFPGNPENSAAQCSDGIDNDCDNDTDTADSDCGTVTDGDGDGFCPGTSCAGALLPNDCDDNDPDEFPGQTFYPDCDGDLFHDGTAITACDRGEADASTWCGTPPEPYVFTAPTAANTDCDDTTGSRSPGNTETGLAECIDNIDNDCNADIDCSDSVCRSSVCRDNDNDGYCEVGERTAATFCSNSDIDSATQDCDDTTNTRYPTNSEQPGDGIDQDCDAVDHCYIDADNDGDGDDSLPAEAALADCSGVGDGYANTQTDCNDAAPAVSGASGLENSGPLCTDTIDNDCDTAIDALDSECGLATIDNDGDGYCESAAACDDGSLPGDCDDGDPTVSPATLENTVALCLDGLNNDCDASVDLADLDSCSLPTLDNDGDGICEGGLADLNGDGECTDATAQADCDDNDPLRYPGNDENNATLCADGIDNDCDNATDSADSTCGTFFDGDGDGYCAGTSCTGGLLPNDCNDGDVAIFPGATEVIADGIDQDCNLVDRCYRDDDNDGNGVSDPLDGTSTDCVADANRAVNTTDCNDTNPTIFVGAPEIAANGIDEDCDFLDDCYTDFDGDGFGVPPQVPGNTLACDGPGESTRDDDCDDTDILEFPSQLFYADCDGDGFYDSAPVVACERTEADSLTGCGAPLGGYVFTAPAAADIDCDDLDGEAFPDQVWYPDCDLDGVASAAAVVACSEARANTDTPCADSNAPDGGWTHDLASPADCDDESALRSPLLDEVCEPAGDVQVDNDCDDDVNTDQDGTQPTNSDFFFTDCDGDGFGQFCTAGDPLCSTLACEAAGTIVTPTCPLGAGLVTNNADCNDDNETVFPGAGEVCDGIDQNCNGLVDEVDFLTPDMSFCIELYRDRDGDGYGDQGATECLCAPDGVLSVEYDNELYVATFSDCDDLHADIKPHECNDGVDNDGDGAIDGLDGDCDPRSDGGVLKQPIVEDGSDSFLTELLDGHDNDCDGFVPLIELDCDDDGALPAIPIPTNTGFYSAEDVGLARCSGGPIQTPCWGETLTLECDETSGLWVTRWGVSDDGFSGRFTNAYRNLTATDCDGANDCDDHCAARCEGLSETCDGIDNDCSGLEPELDDDGIPAALSGEIVVGTVSEAELDRDGDGFAACLDDFRTTDPQIQLSFAACDATVIEDFDSDCDDLCYLVNAQAVETCNGFRDVCDAALALVEGTDGDQDGHSTCGAFGAVDNELDESFYLPVWLAGSSAPAGSPSWVPLVLPRISQAPECDARLSDALQDVLTAVGSSLAEITDETELVSAVCPTSIGTCGVIELTYDPSVDTLESDAPGEALTAGNTTDACVALNEQYLSRAVWDAERMLAARTAVVQAECIRLYGVGCEEIGLEQAATGDPVQPDLTAVVDDPYLWWQEVGRFTPKLTDGALMTCWGDPRDGLRTIADTVGGDCEDERATANRDMPEGPDDLLRLYLGEDGDCGLCTDGIDNNCDGRIDCEDPSCEVCFVGVGRGCDGLKDPCNPDADGGGCQSSPTDGTGPMVGVLIFLLGRRLRKSHRSGARPSTR